MSPQNSTRLSSLTLDEVDRNSTLNLIGPSLSSLTMCLSARPKLIRCQKPSENESESGMDSKCSEDFETDHSVLVDWESLVEPTCLPVTTSFMPDKKVKFCEPTCRLTLFR